MQLKRSELVPIAEAFSDLSGPVAALRDVNRIRLLSMSNFPLLPSSAAPKLVRTSTFLNENCAQAGIEHIANMEATSNIPIFLISIICFLQFVFPARRVSDLPHFLQLRIRNV